MFSEAFLLSSALLRGDTETFVIPVGVLLAVATTAASEREEGHWRSARRGAERAALFELFVRVRACFRLLGRTLLPLDALAVGVTEETVLADAAAHADHRTDQAVWVVACLLASLRTAVVTFCAAFAFFLLALLLPDTLASRVFFEVTLGAFATRHADQGAGDGAALGAFTGAHRSARFEDCVILAFLNSAFFFLDTLFGDVIANEARLALTFGNALECADSWVRV